MTTNIRLLEADDRAEAGLVTLMQEMQAHYKVACPPPEEILEQLKARPDGAEILVAEDDGKVVGLCSFSAIFPGPGLKPGIFLKELYVGAPYRGRGVGRSLMRTLATLAGKRGLVRIDWTADAGNDRLLAFYDDIGGARKTDRFYYRLEGETLDALGRDPAS